MIGSFGITNFITSEILPFNSSQNIIFELQLTFFESLTFIKIQSLYRKSKNIMIASFAYPLNIWRPLSIVLQPFPLSVFQLGKFSWKSCCPIANISVAQLEIFLKFSMSLWIMDVTCSEHVRNYCMFSPKCVFAKSWLDFYIFINSFLLYSPILNSYLYHIQPFWFIFLSFFP